MGKNFDFRSTVEKRSVFRELMLYLSMLDLVMG